MTDRDPADRTEPFAPENIGRFGRRILLEEVTLPPLRSALDLWRDMSEGREIPSRSEFTPGRMKRFLRNVVLLACIDGGKDFVFRVAGDAFVMAYSANLTNRLFSEFPDLFEVSRPALYNVLQFRQPLAFRGLMDRDDVLSTAHETLLLPLGSATEVDHILMIGEFFDRFRPGAPP